jgi:hypothetical protein
MRTKTLFLTLFFVAFFSALQAQVLKGGVNLANVTITNDGDIDENNSLFSFQLGITGDIKLTDVLYFQPGILFTGKGSKTESGDTGGSTWYKATSNPFYAEIPVNLVFKTPGKSLRFFAGAGPYLAIGIAGKNKVNGEFLNTPFSSEDNIEWSDDDPSTLNYEEGAGYGIMKRFDYGLNALAGIEFSKSTLSLNYGFGLAKLQSGSNASADDRNKHRVLSLVLGIKL